MSQGHYAGIENTATTKRVTFVAVFDGNAVNGCVLRITNHPGRVAAIQNSVFGPAANKCRPRIKFNVFNVSPRRQVNDIPFAGFS